MTPHTTSRTLTPMTDYRCWRCLQNLNWQKFTSAKVAVTLINGNALCTDHAREEAEHGQSQRPTHPQG